MISVTKRPATAMKTPTRVMISSLDQGEVVVEFSSCGGDVGAGVAQTMSTAVQRTMDVYLEIGRAKISYMLVTRQVQNKFRLLTMLRFGSRYNAKNLTFKVSSASDNMMARSREI